jgi:hypothetical protein
MSSSSSELQQADEQEISSLVYPYFAMEKCRELPQNEGKRQQSCNTSNNGASGDLPIVGCQYHRMGSGKEDSHIFEALPVDGLGVDGDWDAELLLGAVDVDIVDVLVVLVVVTARVSLTMARSRRK